MAKSSTSIGSPPSTATWTRAEHYKLGAVDDDDPFKPGDVRVWLSQEDEVPPGAEHTFVIPMLAGDDIDEGVTDWRMMHEAVGWFGETTSTTVAVDCPDIQYPLPLPNEWDLVQSIAQAHPGLLADSCQKNDGECVDFGTCGGTWEFLDLVVTELRKIDVRWGYNWKRGVEGDPSQDVVDYHYGSDEREGSEEVYIIDVIVGHCGDGPEPGWMDQTQATADAGTIGRWTGRGRF